MKKIEMKKAIRCHLALCGVKELAGGKVLQKDIIPIKRTTNRVGFDEKGYPIVGVDYIFEYRGEKYLVEEPKFYQFRLWKFDDQDNRMLIARKGKEV